MVVRYLPAGELFLALSIIRSAGGTWADWVFYSYARTERAVTALPELNWALPGWWQQHPTDPGFSFGFLI